MQLTDLVAPNPENDTPVVWRGMMVMKAVQQVCMTHDTDEEDSLTGISIATVRC